jgi:hypothetical protein
MKSSIALIYDKVQGTVKYLLLTQLNPHKIYAQSFGIFGAKTANFTCIRTIPTHHRWDA